MKQLFNLSVKIFGFYFILQIFNMIPQLINLAFTLSMDFGSMGIAKSAFLLQLLYININIAFYSVMGVLLLVKSEKITNLVIKEDTEYPVNVPTTTILSIAFVVMGGLLVINECENFIKLLGNKLLAPQFNMETFHFMASLVKILVGVWLVCSHKWLSAKIAGTQQ